jgi:D-beta-D-heptose 7-phosphate kinase / D-beta-D-heptose 1-phosphate adenosyltransferase
MLLDYLSKSDELIFLLNRTDKMRVLIVGDVMLDEHLWTDVQRISPEAPVQVAEIHHITRTGGGAANVAANVHGLGASVKLIGVVGDDEYGRYLLKLLQDIDIEIDGIITDDKRPTTFKTRVIARNQHIVRIDRETKIPVEKTIENKLCELALENLNNADILIISDYAKGVLTPNLCRTIIGKAKELHKPVIVNPKGKDFGKYRGTTIIVPNEKEAEIGTDIEIHDDQDLKKSAEKLLELTQARWAFITRGSKGISIFSHDYQKSIPAIPVEVYDVTGAGDTVVSVLGTLLPMDSSIESIASLANLAASRVIQKPGVVPITKQELIDCISINKQQGGQAKIKKLDEMEVIVQDLKKQGKKVVFTNGCFDLLHVGHVRLLQQARQKGDVLIVGINSDRSVRKLKGKSRPINRENDRAEVLAGLSFVDYVTIFDQDTPEKVLQKLQVHIHVKGGDYSLEQLPEAKVVKNYGGDIILIPYETGYSTSNVISKIKDC